MTNEFEDLVAKALRRAWHLGQTYSQQADSDSWKQQDKALVTQMKFDTLLEETLAAIKSLPEVDGGDKRDAARKEHK